MIDIINKIFKKDNSTFDSIETNQDRIHLATCAVLLEMANIDGEFSSEEHDNIVSVFKSRYGLNKKDIDELMEASAQELDESVDLWHFTNLINRVRQEVAFIYCWTMIQPAVSPAVLHFGMHYQ